MILILSEVNRFVFIKGVKVAGTSVEMALSRYCGDGCIITPITPIDEIARLGMGRGAQNYSDAPDQETNYLKRLVRQSKSSIKNITPRVSKYFLRRIRPPEGKYYNHMPLSEVMRLQNIDDGMQIVCIERSPYRKVLSWANMRLSMKSYKSGGLMQADRKDLRSFLDTALRGDDYKAVLNIDRYKDVSGKIAVKRILRYENIQSDLRDFVDTFGRDDVSLDIPHAKKGLMSNELPLDAYFSKDHIKRINEVFEEEFSFFGHEKV